MRAIFGVVGTVRWRGEPVGGTGVGYMPEERGMSPGMRVGEQLEYLGCLHDLSAPQARAAAARWLARLGQGPMVAPERR
jgi:ABC-2 type transport system ATP-binding protein